MNDYIEEMQDALNKQIYTDLLTYYSTVAQVVDKEQAFNLLVTSLATTLGVIIAQVPDQHKNDFLKTVDEIIKQSTTETLKNLDNINWGQIGHA
jgi:flagellar motor switch protein FliG